MPERKSTTRGNVHTADVMREVVLKFARKVAKNPHDDHRPHSYPTHIDKDERHRRDEAARQVAQTSDEREWDLVLRLAERYDVSPLMLSEAIAV